MTHNMNDMVAVASGPSTTVARWARLLRRAAISCHIAAVTWPDDGSDCKEAELWVIDALADEARSVIRSAEVPGAMLIW